MNRNRNDLGFESTALNSFAGLLPENERHFVLIFTGNAEFFSDVFSRDAHVVVVESIPQAVFDHGIDEDAVAHAVAITALRTANGAMDMFSMPPATMTSASPALII